MSAHARTRLCLYMFVRMFVSESYLSIITIIIMIHYDMYLRYPITLEVNAPERIDLGLWCYIMVLWLGIMVLGIRFLASRFTVWRYFYVNFWRSRQSGLE